jgi:nucleoside-diphosphate-sugar epimerase
VRDLSAAFLAVLEAPSEAVANQAFNVGREGDNYRVRDLAAAVGGEFKDSVVVYENRSAASDPRSYRVSFRKLWSAFPDLRFEWDVAKGLRELRQAFEQQGFTAERFQHRDFYRLRQIQHLLETGALDGQLRWAASPASAANLS